MDQWKRAPAFFQRFKTIWTNKDKQSTVLWWYIAKQTNKQQQTIANYLYASYIHLRNSKDITYCSSKTSPHLVDMHSIPKSYWTNFHDECSSKKPATLGSERPKLGLSIQNPAPNIAQAGDTSQLSRNFTPTIKKAQCVAWSSCVRLSEKGR